jgi:sugar-specific transcriptional regulator TrmB
MVETNRSICVNAPLRTAFATPIASAISFLSIPLSWAFLIKVFRQGWQLAVTAAPTAMSNFVLISITDLPSHSSSTSHCVVENYLRILCPSLLRNKEKTTVKGNDTIARERIITRLKDLALSTHEAQTYATLLTHPTMTASALCKDTGISDTKIYYALDGLSEKGMLVVRNGNPKVYRAVPPKEAIANLKQRLTDRLNEELKEADVLVDMLLPLYESAEKTEELEVAYIIRGHTNITNRLKALIENARKEVTLFVSHPALFKELTPTLRAAQDIRKIRLNIAMTEEMLGTENIKWLDDARQLCCPVTLLISDLKTLLTVSDWGDETATLSQDQNLIRVARDYYDNSLCYTP